MGRFDPTRFPEEEPHDLPFVTGEQTLEELLDPTATEVGDSALVFGLAVMDNGESLHITPIEYVRPVARLYREDISSVMDLLSELEYYHTLVWDEMTPDERLECFKVATNDEQQAESNEHYLYIDESLYSAS
ncbi:hypothetical protein [Halosegnis longus]|uniref:hypothetical protein n=1 Tax=Halosegnis longus TaxID=2216012 RepID=UPI00129D7A86|nr:hypothetical protein [Halosegnis longus]